MSDFKPSYNNHKFTIIIYYDTSYGKAVAYRCKYCLCAYGNDKNCISDEEKMIKDLIRMTRNMKDMNDLVLIYNTDGHIFIYNNAIRFHCKYCNTLLGEKEDMSKCITDEEKMIKDLVE